VLHIHGPIAIMQPITISQLVPADTYNAVFRTTRGVCYMRGTNTEWCESECSKNVRMIATMSGSELLIGDINDSGNMKDNMCFTTSR
jgi:hypothetical protein